MREEVKMLKHHPHVGAHPIDAVSYTHLDVYKRQAFSVAALAKTGIWYFEHKTGIPLT